jgi:hypothetical protein
MKIRLTVLFAVAWFGSPGTVAQKDPMRIPVAFRGRAADDPRLGRHEKSVFLRPRYRCQASASFRRALWISSARSRPASSLVFA